MKPLLAQKVQRLDVASPVNEWEPAKHHLTHEGQNAFHARMLARIKAAQEKPANVRAIQQRKERKA